MTRRAIGEAAPRTKARRPVQKSIETHPHEQAPASDLPWFKQTAAEGLAAALGGDIIRGVPPPGERLPNETALLRRFDVSRPTLREAFRVLVAKRLIVSRQKVGTTVRARADWNALDPDVLTWHLNAAPTASFVAQLFELRQMVEPEASAAAANSADEAAVAAMRKAYRDMEARKNGRGDLIGADLRFHQAILDAAHNPFVSALGGLIHTALIATFKLGWRGAIMKDDRLRQHLVILEAIERRQPQEARELMITLLRDSLEDVLRAIKTRK
jgi:DNA-binding FadR family transcriptional regulator